MKPPRRAGIRARPGRTQLKRATVEARAIPEDYRPPAQVPRPDSERNVEHPRPRPYRKARGVKAAAKLPPQPETTHDSGGDEQ